MKQLKEITVYRDDFVQLPSNWREFIEFFADKLDEVPEKFIESTIIDVEACDSAIEINMYYTRRETDFEEAERNRVESIDVLRNSERNKTRDLKLLAELKAKYES